MKILVLANECVGRTVSIKEKERKIIVVDRTTAETKFVRLDLVGEDVLRAGFAPGDLVLPRAIGNFVLGGRYRPVVLLKDFALVIKGADLDSFEVQTDDGKKFVSFNDPAAAKPIDEVLQELAPQRSAAE